MGVNENGLLAQMLDRLFAAIARGPSIDCKPASSRQRIDLTELSALGDLDPTDIIAGLMSEAGTVRITGKIERPPPLVRAHRTPSGRPFESGEPADPDAADASPTSTTRGTAGDDTAKATPAVPPAAAQNDGTTSTSSAATPSGTDQPDRASTELPRLNRDPAAHVDPSDIEDGGLTLDPVAGSSVDPDAGTGVHSSAGSTGETPTEDVSGPASSRQSDRAAAERAWSRQQAVIRKLRHIAEEARTYEEDTGVYVLNVGFPLLHLPRISEGSTARVLAPVAFIPVRLTVSSGVRPVVELSCHYSGEDRVVPNQSLLSWVERQSGCAADDLFADAEGSEPWREIHEIVSHVCGALEMSVPEWVSSWGEASDAEPASFVGCQPAPSRTAEGSTRDVCRSAVVGLFPVSNQSLLRDTQQLVTESDIREPLRSFLSVNPSVAAEPDEQDQSVQRRRRSFAEERFVQVSDPCQARAVRLAREVGGLVVHGPPGTGKSQTIANIIGDHLARGERVLFVCEKRTAIDVVANRLKHVGLGDLLAVIHDVKRDQRDLYMGMRKQLEDLSETYPPSRPDRDVQAVDRQLQSLHDELSIAWRSLMVDEDADEEGGVPDTERAGQEGSFHALVGQWLAIDSAVELPVDRLQGLTIADVEASELAMQGILERGLETEYGSNPWPGAAGLSLETLLGTPADQFRASLDACVEAATAADATRVEGQLPFRPADDPTEQARMSSELADRLEAVMAVVPAPIRTHWAMADPDTIGRAHAGFVSVASAIDVLRRTPPDADIDFVLESEQFVPAKLVADIASLVKYQSVSTKWWGVLDLGTRKAAGRVVRRYGMSLDADGVARVLSALRGRRAAMTVQSTLIAAGVSTSESSPAALESVYAHHHSVTELLRSVSEAAIDSSVGEAVGEVLRGTVPVTSVAELLRSAARRAEAIRNLVSTVRASQLFRDSWILGCVDQLCRHEPVERTFERLRRRFGSLEDVLRIENGLERLPVGLRPVATVLLEKGLDPRRGKATLVRGLLARQITDRISATKPLQELDGRRIESAFTRMGELQHQKMSLVRAAITARWIRRQRERLLVSTGTRLNSTGADLKRRLLTRGRRAMRLRQVIKHGRSIEDGDPIFDLRPVWMASPETVAQIFPREAIFDVVIFDEASQCRLEEALPVLTRAKRVVVAGDPKQLPPSRFFESAVIASEQREIESDQDLFEVQQGDVEDLLTAALNLEIENAYLDVHYRSQNADLISFSNHQFYGSRLQAIPGHPSNRTRFAPLQLIPANGIYAGGENPIEADRVVQLVQDLLRRAAPPSIGIVAFNVAQRDLILDSLEDAAQADAEFARRLDVARHRRGAGSFDGLFVKNLESVQGDERDHIIISTTYGPNEDGRFYRRFGPLLQAGGGRRLNVLVTRARQEVHLVTSIPAESYRALPPVPEGQAPGGGWLLFAYLRYAERLAEIYEEANQERDASRSRDERAIRLHATASPSLVSESLARSVASRGHGSEVYWGNDGFCVDIAIDHPTRPDDVSIGVQVDMTRFRGAADPVEWEVFRQVVLESQGWDLHRVWSPTIFRDLTGTRESVADRIQSFLAADHDPDEIRTWEHGSAHEEDA